MQLRHRRETADKIHTVKRIIVHEQYDSITYENDIAIIQLKKPAIFDKSVWPICLPDEEETFESYRATVIGWGTIYYGGPVSPILQEVNIREGVSRRGFNEKLSPVNFLR